MGLFNKREYENKQSDAIDVVGLQRKNAWEAYDNQCAILTKNAKDKFYEEAKIPFLHIVSFNFNNSVCLVKADTNIIAMESRKYMSSWKRYERHYDKAPTLMECTYLPVPEYNYEINSVVTDRIKHQWKEQTNIVLDLADGITTLCLKYDDTDNISVIDIYNFEELEALMGDSASKDNGQQFIGYYPELKNEMAKWKEDFEKAAKP